ncbi:MAG: SpoIIE family protein phosphatase [Oscillospiraceae bacterium]|jgi:stage II sporulation protein E|nr:SpoIIE family protein phosphatase [Oscillospiraceae bacterium]
MEPVSTKAAGPRLLGRILECIKNTQKAEKQTHRLRSLVLLAAAEMGAAVLAGLLTRPGLAGGAFAPAAPFAMALAAAGSVRFLGMEVFGIAAGSLLLLPYPSCVTVMAAGAAAGLLNLACRKCGAKRTVAAPLSACVCAAAASVLSFAAAPPAQEIAWVFALCGAALAGCMAYFIVQAQGVRGAGPRALLPQDCAALLLCCGMCLSAFGGYTLGLFCPARVVGVLLVLAAACCWRETGGAVAGLCVGLSLTLAGGDPSFAAVYGLGGLLAGFMGCAGFQRRRRRPKTDAMVRTTLPAAGGFALASVFYVALRGAATPDPSDVVIFALETLGAVVVFAAIPARVWNTLRVAAQKNAQVALPPAESQAKLRLAQTAMALRRVGEYISEVSAGLEKLSENDSALLFAAARQPVCDRCEDRDKCQQRFTAFDAWAAKTLRRSRDVTQEEIVDARHACGIRAPCKQPEELRAALACACNANTTPEAHSVAESQLRQIAAAQFETLAALLDELGAQLEQSAAAEDEMVQTALRVLEDHGFRAQAVAATRGTTPQNPAHLAAAVHPREHHSTKKTLAAALTRATGIPFALSKTTPLAEGMLLTFAQAPRYRLETGAVQMSSSASAYCGDYFDCFDDGMGREVLVISDGMGTGGRAAVDSALAAEVFGALARCGVGFKNAVNVVNQALLLKSCDETLATLDVVGVNLYSGEVSFCKAGGSVSFLRQGAKVTRLELSALPAGILRTICPAQAQTTLAPGDILVMVSDGMLCGGDAWLCQALARWPGGTMQALADHLAALAVGQREQSAREDDLTVLCALLLLQKN